MKNTIYPIIDAHADTIERCYTDGLQIGDSTLHAPLSTLKEAGYHAQVFSLWVSPEFPRERALLRAMQLASWFLQAQKEHGIRLIKTKEDLLDPSFGAILSLEGSAPLVDDPEMLEVFYALGVRMASLTWNDRNPFADGLEIADNPSGITHLGKRLIKKMQALGVVLDLSHLAETGFWDIMENVEGPVALSHANAYALCPHPRNLKDEQLKAIAERKGVVGVCFAPKFLARPTATIDDAVTHVEYLCEKMGIDCVGLGSDFDGISSTPAGLSSPLGTVALLERLKERGFGEADLKKLAGENWQRLFNTIWK